MPSFLDTSGLGATLQMLAQGQPSLIGALGQEVQRSTQAKKEQEVFEMNKQLQQMNLDKGKLEMMNQNAQQTGSFADSMIKAYPNEKAMSQNWAASRERMIKENPALANSLPEQFPGMAQLRQLRDQSLTFYQSSQLELQRQMLAQQRKATEERAKEGRGKTTLKQTVKADDANTFLTGQTLEGNDQAIVGEMSTTDQGRTNQLLSSRANQIILEREAAGQTISETAAMQQAWEEMKANKIVIENTGIGFNDYTIDPKKYAEFNKLWSGPLVVPDNNTTEKDTTVADDDLDRLM